MEPTITVAEAALWFALIALTSAKVGWEAAKLVSYRRGLREGAAAQERFSRLKSKETR
jgi:hypothetical protein